MLFPTHDDIQRYEDQNQSKTIELSSGYDGKQWSCLLFGFWLQQISKSIVNNATLAVDYAADHSGWSPYIIGRMPASAQNETCNSRWISRRSGCAARCNYGVAWVGGISAGRSKLMCWSVCAVALSFLRWHAVVVFSKNNTQRNRVQPRRPSFSFR